MDRSYPYSRRLLSRARLRKRMGAVTAAGLVGATALFMLTWKPDPISAALPPAALAPALGDGLAAGEPGRAGVRRIYPYSVVPGGVSSQAELKRVIRTDSVVAAHYATFDTNKAHAVVVDKPRAVHVSYRKGDKVYWTAHKVMLAAGETLLSDGSSEMRARCANRISDLPQYPVEAHRPAMAELDQAVEIADGEQLASGPEGLPVSMGADALGRQAGVRVPGRSYNAGGTGSGSADASAAGTLAGSASSHVPGLGSVTTTGLSGSSSSMGSSPRPGRPATGSQLATPDQPGGPEADSDSSTGSSGSPPPSGAAPVQQPGAGEPESPLPDTATPQPPPAPAPSPDGSAADPAPAVPRPAPGTQPTPGPATGQPAPAPGLPSVPSTGEQSGGGGGGTPQTPPGGASPQPSQPAPETSPVTDPLPPKPGQDPVPTQPGAAEPAPTEVPEPANIWLFGLALAALAVLRRRPA